MEDTKKKKFINDNINIYKNYCDAIKEYENYLNKIYQNLSENNEMYNGYLIDSKEFNKLKEDIYLDFYKLMKTEYKEQIQIKLQSLISKNESIELKKFEQVDIKSYDDFLNKLKNNNEFILITVSLWKTIRKKEKENEEPLIYFINKSELILSLKDNNNIYFRHNNNILNKDLLIQNNEIINNQIHKDDIKKDIDMKNDHNKNNSKNNINNYINIDNNQTQNNNIIKNIDDNEKLENLVNTIEEFYLFQKKINNKSSNSSEDYYYGYLVNKKIIEQWKKNINYGNIKKNYLNNKNGLSREQKNEIIKNHLNNNSLNKIGQVKCFDFKTKDEFIDLTSKNALVLINKKIYSLMNGTKEIEEKEIKYKIKDNTIIFNIFDSDFNFYSTNNNIISYYNINLLILINIFYLQKEIKEKINSSNVSNGSYFLVDKDFIKKLKEYFSYDKLEYFLNNNNYKEILANNTLNDEDQIFEIIQRLPSNYIQLPINKFESKIKDIESLIKDIKLRDDKNLKYIDDFEIININILKPLKFIYILKKKPFPAKFYFIKDKIIMIFKENEIIYGQIGYLNNLNIFIIEYLIDIEDSINKSKNIGTYDKILDLNNFYNEIYNNNNMHIQLNNNIIFNIKKMPNNNNDYNQNFLNDDTQTLIKLDSFDKNEDDKLKNYIQLLIIFIQTEISIKSKISQNNNEENEYIFINQKWIDEFKLIFNYDEIITNEIQRIISENINDDALPQKVLEELSKDSKTKLINLKEDEIYNALNNNDLYKIEEYNFNNLIYYLNFGLIDQKIFDHFHNINVNINIEEKKVLKQKCLFFKDKIYFSLSGKEYNIYIGHYENNLFITEIIINSIHQKNIEFLMDLNKKYGYNHIKLFLFESEIYEIEKSSIKIIKILKNLNNNYFNESILNKRLKCLIQLEIYQQDIIEKTKQNINYYNQKTEKVYLIDLNNLNNYGYKQIMTIINKNNKLKNIKENYKDTDEFINKIILDLNINDIKELVQYLNKIDFDKIDKKNLFSHPKKLNLQNNKYIIFFNDFIVVNKSNIELLKDTSSISTFEFISGNKKNILIIKNQNQNTLLIGSVLNNENIFKLEYILNFFEDFQLDIELNDIFTDNNKYINNRLIFNDENENSSPIFNELDDTIIGHGYKFNDNNFNCNNNIDFNINDDIIKMLNLFNYYYFLNSNITNNNNKNDELSPDEYYLINEGWINDIKDSYNFKMINEILNSNHNAINILDNLQKDNSNFKLINLKNIYSIIKCLDNNSYNNIIKNITNNKEFKNDISVLMKEINYCDNSMQDKNIYIYDDFEILSKNIVKELIKDKNKDKNIEEIFSKCIIKDKSIIINLKKEGLPNSQSISLIGNLNHKNTFSTDYILIFNEEDERNKFFDENELNDFLTKCNFYKDSSPLIDNGFRVLGTIVKYKSNDNNNIVENQNNNINNNVPQNIYEVQDYQYNNNDFNDNDNDKEYNLDYTTNSPKIKDNFPFPPLIGLQNIGATCYMNATLQCFCHIEQFVNYFKYNKHIINIVRNNKKNLTASFKLLIEKLWPNGYNQFNQNKKVYTPEEFKAKISTMNPLFKGVAANDAKDLVNFIIMTLHEELNKANIKNNDNNLILDQRNQQLMFNNFIQEFKNSNQSIISDLFYAINCSMTKCGYCNTETYNYQAYFFIVFPLEEVRKFKSNNNLNQFNNFNNFFNNNFYNNFNNNYNNDNNVVNIYDCFNYDKRINVMSGENSMYCNFCQKTCQASICTFLTSGPNILILLLNRGKRIEFNVKIQFPELLDLSPFIVQQCNNMNIKYNYKLIGVITHIGESGMGGHFIAYCRDPITNNWHKYNDAMVNEVTNFHKDVINFAMPYLLFYQKI